MINSVSKNSGGALPVDGVSSQKDATSASQAAESIQPTASHAPSSTAVAQVEQVALSEKAQLAQALTKATNASTGVDVVRVQAIRQSITNGSYQVSPEAIIEAVAKVSWILGGNKG